MTSRAPNERTDPYAPVHSTHQADHLAIPFQNPSPRSVPVRNHASGLVLSLIVLITIGTGFLILPVASREGSWTPPIDALFTAVSAVCVKGLVVVPTAEHWSFAGQVVILAMIQLGGLGFMVGTTIVLVTLGRGTSLRDALLIHDGTPTIPFAFARKLAIRTAKFTIAVEAIGAMLLIVGFRQESTYPDIVWMAIFHSVSAFCNAGFDLQPNGQSLQVFSGSLVVNSTIMALIQLGGLSYLVLSEIVTVRRWHPLSLYAKLVVLMNGGLVVVGALLFLILERNASLVGLGGRDRLLASLFQSVSARTAGFATVPFDQITQPIQFVWMLLMLVGGAAGSTAGGVKLATSAVLVLAIASTLRGHEHTHVFGRRISAAQVLTALALIITYIAMHFTLTLVLAAVEDLSSVHHPSFLAYMFEVMSALATVGLSTGITPDLSDAAKLVLCIGMVIGRVGPLALMDALSRTSKRNHVRFPDASIRMG